MFTASATREGRRPASSELVGPLSRNPQASAIWVGPVCRFPGQQRSPSRRQIRAKVIGDICDAGVHVLQYQRPSFLQCLPHFIELVNLVSSSSLHCKNDLVSIHRYVPATEIHLGGGSIAAANIMH